jgi:hypothetical protein
MSRSGKDFGRLIPDITRIRYIDWKWELNRVSRDIQDRGNVNT